MNQYSADERATNCALWEDFLSTTPFDGFNTDEVETFLGKAGDWHECAVGCLATPEQREECERWTYNCGVIRVDLPDETEAEARIAATSPRLFMLGCAFETAMAGLFDEVTLSPDSVEAHDALALVSEAWHAVKQEVAS